MGTNSEFLLILSVIIIVIQAVHNMWLSYVAKECKEEVLEIREVLALAAQGKVQLKIEEEE